MCKIAIISTVKAPTEQLKLFVQYHTSIGIDKIILFFDDPDDDAIRSLPNYFNLTLIPCSDAYWKGVGVNRPSYIEERQIINVNNAVKLLKVEEYDWLVHIDSDELIYPKLGIKIFLKDCDSDAVKLELLEAVSEKEHYDNIYEPRLFKKASTRFHYQLARLLGCRHSFYNNEYIRGHTKSKMIIKINADISKYGIHGPLEYPESLKITNTHKIQLLHYDCIGIDNWKGKWSMRLEGSGAAHKMRGNRKQQFEEYKNAVQKGDKELSKVYLRIHTIPKYEKIILKLLGLLKKVDIHIYLV